ncbi:hypothetical protein NLJ89_g7343 [Agrocybe chaxingu]|uniref:polynucleotide adenylyltransferase n=1 Tax=Agrocybe chaxingu TaxID=84603 RepID=A0A9W8MV57_9AGAR|nr:hypothetical protein NLJ89_g7343 [Agrocybe chaxingu]
MASGNANGYLGVTPPISTAVSTEREKEVTVSLMEELRRQNTFESEEEAKTREIVLGRVAALVTKFVKKVSLERGLSEAAANAAGGKIFTFGSYRLGVHGPGTDIDTLCVVPKHVSREDFFDVFEPMLKEMEGVTEVSGVPEAYVPIIKSEICGVQLDFLMARLALSSVPDNLSLKDDNLLRNLDERCVRSLNASTQMIITEEFKRGAEIVDRVIVGRAEWSELFAKHDFFHKYRYYLQVIASTGNQELQLKWSGTVESRLRQLVMKLEYVDSLVLAHPFVKGFDQVSYCLNEDEVRSVAQGEISDAIASRKKEDIEGKEGVGPVYSTTFYIGLAIEPKQVKMWDKFDDATMGIVVRHIKRLVFSGLPDNVFDPGERPAKLAQKRSKGSSKSNNTPPDMPNKRQRSSQSTTDLSAKSENGLSATPTPSLPLVAENLGQKERSDIRTPDLKTPFLPFGENVAVATGPIGAQ